MRNPVPRRSRSGMRARGAKPFAAGLVLLLADIALAAGPGTLHAASGTAAHDREVPGSLVSRLRANGADLTRLATAHGLDGWNVRLADGSSYILYLTPDGAGVIGHLYGPDGHSVTARHLQALARDRTGTGNTPMGDRAAPAIPAHPAPSTPGADGAQPGSLRAANPAGAPPGSGPDAPAPATEDNGTAPCARAGDGSASRTPACAPGAGGKGPAGFAAAHETATPARTADAVALTGASAFPSRPGAATARGSPGAARPAGARPSTREPVAAAPVSPAAAPGTVSGTPGLLATGPRGPDPARTTSAPETAASSLSRSGALPGTGHRTPGEAALLRRTREAPGIELLAGFPVLHVIADPGCGPSRAWIDTLLRYRTAGFGLRVLPVGLMGAASARAALWILEQPDRAAAWHATAGRPISDGDLAGTSADLLAGNNALFAAWRGRVLPLSLRAVPEGVERIDGVPGDAAALVRRLVLEDPR